MIILHNSHTVIDRKQGYHAKEFKKNLASAKIVKIEFNANLDLLHFPYFITFKECKKEP